ncbi:MAG: hypothetical protein WCC94_03090 [Candidatus Bathyarchaeia archaeon]
MSSDRRSLYGGRKRRGMRHVVVAVPRPRPGQHHLKGIVVEAPPELRRFKEAGLDNPKTLDPAKLRGGETTAYTYRGYNPKKYNPKDPGRTGVRDIKTVPSSQIRELQKEVRGDLGGALSASAESSHEPRRYVQRTVKTPKGIRHRPAISVRKFLEL